MHENCHIHPIFQSALQSFITSAQSSNPNPKPCLCVVYPFPHRAGGGKCTGAGEPPSSCIEREYSYQEHDPYLTGDNWYSEQACSAPNGCPWGIA